MYFLQDYDYKFAPFFFDTGIAYCVWCRDTLNYGRNGRRVLALHSRTAKHKKSKNTVKNSQTLPALFRTVRENSLQEGPSSSDNSKDLCSRVYGAPLNTHGSS